MTCVIRLTGAGSRVLGAAGMPSVGDRSWRDGMDVRRKLCSKGTTPIDVGPDFSSGPTPVRTVTALYVTVPCTSPLR